MSEFDIIKKTEYPNTLQTIKDDLKKLGINQGDIVLVHSSMSKIGWVCGDEITIVQALLEAVGEEGTIIMPAHTGNNTNPDEWAHPPVPDTWKDEIRNTMPAFNVKNTPTRGMGKICECFRNYEGTVRSNHPQFSFCANGKYKNEIVKTHDLTYALGMNTPLGKLYELNAKILLLGVGYNNCTSMHVAETLITNPHIIRKGTAMEIEGKRVWKWYDDIDYSSDSFDEIGLLYEKKHKDVILGKIGCANCRILNLRNIVDFTKEFLEENNNMNILYTKCGKEDIKYIISSFKNQLDSFDNLEESVYNSIIEKNINRIDENIDLYTKVLCNNQTISYYSCIEEDKKVEIKDFYVDQEYQNRGFGKKILNNYLDIAKKNNILSVYTILYINDSRYIELFTKCGFSVREMIGESRCVMSKKIENSL